MRNFTTFEQDIIRRIGKIREKKDSNPKDIELTEIIRTELGAFAVEWNKKKREIIILRVEKNKANYYLFRLVSIISLLKYLEENNCVFLTKMSDDKENNRYLFDREKYERVLIPALDEDGKSNTANTKRTKPSSDQKYAYRKKEGHTKLRLFSDIIYTDLSEYLEYYSSMLIIPTQTLLEHVENKFKTYEQIRFEEQLGVSKHQTNTGYIAAGLSFLGLLAAIIIPFCTSTKIDEDSTKEIEKIIRENKITIPQTINTNITNDTLKVNVINSPSTKTNHDQPK